MASQKMTFTIPAELAARFAKRVPVRKRSGYVAEAIAAKLSEREMRLIRACEIANSDPGVREIEEEFDALKDEITEPWEDTAKR